MRFRRFLTLSVVVLLGVPSCAQGGGDTVPDTGPPGLDSGTNPDTGQPGLDSGAVMLLDSGPGGGFDAGEVTGDAGNDETDAGDAVDGGMVTPDAGAPDAGAPDAGPPVGCRTSAECSDGLACNGTEACIGGECMPGTPFACDDGIVCTRDACVEGSPPSCSFIADDALCPGGQTCEATGCMPTCAETPCRLVSPQCGCPGGQACVISSGTRICTVEGTAPIGGTCAGLFSCVAGSICINVARSGPAANMCNRFCEVDGDCAGGLCLYELNDGMGGAVPGVRICSNPCDPISGSGCPTGTGCTVFQESGGAERFFSDCAAPVGTGVQGTACVGQEDCATGFGCFGTPGQCLQWCDGIGLSGALGGCAAGLTCFGFTTPIVVGGTQLGVCDV